MATSTAQDIGAARRLHTWLAALDALHAEARRLGAEGVEAADEAIAVLHVLEDRSHRAFEDYRAYVLASGG